MYVNSLLPYWIYIYISRGSPQKLVLLSWKRIETVIRGVFTFRTFWLVRSKRIDRFEYLYIYIWKERKWKYLFYNLLWVRVIIFPGDNYFQQIIKQKCVENFYFFVKSSNYLSLGLKKNSFRYTTAWRGYVSKFSENYQVISRIYHIILKEHLKLVKKISFSVN